MRRTINIESSPSPSQTLHTYTERRKKNTTSVKMAAADVQSAIPSHMRPVPGSFNIPVAKFPPAVKADNTVDAAKAASTLVDTFNEQLANQSFTNLSHNFTEDGYWRDHLALTWAFRTAHRPATILSFLQSASKSRDGFRLKRIAVDDSSTCKEPKVASVDAAGEVSGVQFFIKLETAIGTGTGLVKLVQEGREWKIFTLFTRLEELRGFEESVNERRGKGVEHGGKPGRKNWAERRETDADFTSTEPAVLVIGKSSVSFFRGKI